MIDQKEKLDELFIKDKFVLIVFDDFRYDVFKKYCNLEGELRKLETKGTHTYVWLKRNFTDKYPEIKIFSMHPVINPMGVTPDSWIPTTNRDTFDSSTENKWTSTGHFKSENITLIAEEYDKFIFANQDSDQSPANIAKESLSKINEIPDKTIIWLMFPHEPYIDTGDTDKERYLNSCKLSLKIVKSFIDKHDLRETKNVVLTSDHGEIFEPPEKFNLSLPWKTKLGHEPGVDDSRLKEVPWLRLR